MLKFDQNLQAFKIWVNRKWLGKIENLIFDMWIIIFYFMEFIAPSLFPPPPPPPDTHPVPSPSLNPTSLQSPAEVLLRFFFFFFFFTFKEDHVSLFLVKMFLKPVHTRLNKRPSVFFFFLLFLFFLIVCGHIHIRGLPKSFVELGRIAIYFRTAIIFRELGNKP